MITVDASALIAYLNPTDAHHHAAVDALAAAVPPLLIHALTAAEVLVGPTRNGVADKVWSDLAAIGVEIDRTPIDPWQLARLRVNSGCKLPDCCVLAVAATHGTDVIAFDERILRYLQRSP